MRFWSGAITGVVVSAIVLLVGLTRRLLPQIVEQVPALTADDVPRATAMVTGAGWAIAAPAALGLLLLAANVVPGKRETVRFVALILVAVASAAVIAFTLVGMSLALSDVTLGIGPI